MGEAQRLYQLIMYLSCVFESYLLYCFLKSTFSVYDEERVWVKFLGIIGCATMMFGVNSLHLPGVNLVCIPLIFFLFAWIIFRMEFKYNILYVLMFYLTLAIIEFIFYQAYKIFDINSRIIETKQILLLLLQHLFRMMVVQMFNKHHYEEAIKNSDSYRYLKFLFVLPIATFILLNGFIVSDTSSFKFFLISMGGILMIISNVVEFAIVEKLLGAEQRAKNREMLEQKTKLEQTYYLRLEEINRGNAEYIHEMNHIIRTIQELAHTENNDTVQSLITEATQKRNPMLDKYYIGDKITNAIFLEREKKAASLGVKYQVDIQPGIDLSFIEEVDKISMFGNLIDNALEAAVGRLDGQVLVSLFAKCEAFVTFKVENNFAFKPEKCGSKYLSRKRDKERHGFGIKKVEELTEKYKGVFNMLEEENTFTVILVLAKK